MVKFNIQPDWEQVAIIALIILLAFLVSTTVRGA